MVMIKWIPVDICIYALKEKKVSVLRTYLFLKLFGKDGHLKLSSEMVGNLAERSGKNQKSAVHFR